jgi:carbon storage regulator
MLILARKQDQSVIIDGRIGVKIVSLDRFQVRLGIDAPKDVPVHREEIQAQIARSERAQGLARGASAS